MFGLVRDLFLASNSLHSLEWGRLELLLREEKAQRWRLQVLPGKVLPFVRVAKQGLLRSHTHLHPHLSNAHKS